MKQNVRLVAVETSSRVGSVALSEDGRVIDERRITEGMRHGRELLPMVDAAMRAAGWPVDGIDLVAVGAGPGSFTGLRIAVMFARTVAWRVGARALAVPTLRVIAANAPADRSGVAVVVDAQRGGVYWATYRRGPDGSLERTTEEAVAPPAEVASRLAEDMYLIGSGLERYADLFGDRPRAAEPLWWPRAGVVAELGWAMHLAGEHMAAEMLEPLYVRRPAPEEMWERRQRGGR